MFEKTLSVADLHFTAAEEDSYRWDIVPWLIEQVETLGITDLILSGDLTDFKDNHPAELVNLLVDNVTLLAQYTNVHFLMGNHDFLKREWPFFRFLKHIPNIFYHDEPKIMGRFGYALLPFTKTPEVDWKDLDLKKVKHLFMHQPVIGAKSSDFYELEHGLSPTYFSKEHPEFTGTVWSGDIHIDQVVGDVNYIGAPYHIKHGDTVNGRAIFIDSDKKSRSIEYKSIKKWSLKVTDLADLKSHGISEGDQAIIKVLLTGYTYENWIAVKREIESYLKEIGCRNNGLSLDPASTRYDKKDGAEETVSKIKDVTNDNEVINVFSEREELDTNIIEIGNELIRDTWRDRVAQQV